MGKATKTGLLTYFAVPFGCTMLILWFTFQHLNLLERNEKIDKEIQKLLANKSHFYNGYSNRPPSLGFNAQYLPVVFQDQEAVSKTSLRANPCLEFMPKRRIVESGKILAKEELVVESRKNLEPLIPKIIHQQFKSYKIPVRAKELVQSVVMNHPLWDYWFWTDKDCDCYIKTRHPHLWKLWSNYKHPINRADVMRYVVMYDFGGFYIDLDIVSLKALDVFGYLAHSIMTHETYETSFLLHDPSAAYVSPTVLASRPKHPFYKRAINANRLKKYHDKCPDLPTHCTGQHYMDDTYQDYLKENLENLSPEDDILILHPRQVM